MDTLIQQLINGLTLGSIYALVALGYTMVYGILGLINFAHGEVVMIGALTALAAIKPLAAAGLPGPLAVLAGCALAMLVCLLLGLIIERVAYRPLRRAPRVRPRLSFFCKRLLFFAKYHIKIDSNLMLPQDHRPSMTAGVMTLGMTPTRARSASVSSENSQR